MTLAMVPLTPLEAGQRHAWRARAAAFWLAVLAGAVVAELLWSDNLWFRGAIAGPVLAIGLWRVLLVPRRRWRRWGYAFTGGELHVAHGLLVEYYTIVPVVRVQHLDIEQGPLERAFRVCTLVLYTAGSDENAVVLPGLTRETAEAIRDAIRTRIGSAAE